MRDLSAGVKAALTAVISAPVYYAYPAEWAALPLISFFELDNAEAEHADDEELTSDISYTIDIWALSPEETHALAAKVNQAMRSIGFKRDGSNDLYEAETRYHHKTMRFSITAITEE